MQATYPIYLLPTAQEEFDRLCEEFVDFEKLWESGIFWLKKFPNNRSSASEIKKDLYVTKLPINLPDERQLFVVFKYNKSCIHVASIRCVPL